jgi:polyhydroxyalkanoic acid synthase PhaR subunit
MSQQGSSASDPFQVWRDWVSNSERQWNAFFNDAMATDEFSQAMGRGMDMYLGLQKNLNEVMGRYFSTMNMPTRDDILALGNRLTAVEDRLAGLEAAINRLAKANPQPKATGSSTTTPPKPRPARTKRPAKS